jgi:transposase
LCLDRKEAIMGAWKLDDEEWNALDELRFKTGDADLFRNATVILMTGVGRSKFDIAQDLGCSPATVDNVRKRYRERGLVGLQRRKSPGRPPRATPEYRAALREAVQTPPQTLGYGFSVWSANRLAKHLEKKTKIALGDDRLRAILGEEGFSFQRPKHTMKGKRDEIAYERARGELKTLKKKRCARTLARR